MPRYIKFPPHLDYLRNKDLIWFNPCWGFYAFWERFEIFKNENDLDYEDAWLHKKMKNNKEKYFAALVALFLQQNNYEKNGWWFTKTSQDPPDAIVGTPRETNIGNIISVREIEITEHIGDGDILETIEKKLGRKMYEPNTILVCFISPKNIKTFNFKEISANLIKENFSLKNIFILFHGFYVKSSKIKKEEILLEMQKISFIQLTPVYNSFSLLPQDCCKNFLSGSEKAWLKFSGRGLKPGFQDSISDGVYKIFD